MKKCDGVRRLRIVSRYNLQTTKRAREAGEKNKSGLLQKGLSRVLALARIEYKRSGESFRVTRTRPTSSHRNNHHESGSVAVRASGTGVAYIPSILPRYLGAIYTVIRFPSPAGTVSRY